MKIEANLDKIIGKAELNNSVVSIDIDSNLIKELLDLDEYEQKELHNSISNILNGFQFHQADEKSLIEIQSSLCRFLIKYEEDHLATIASRTVEQNPEKVENINNYNSGTILTIGYGTTTQTNNPIVGWTGSTSFIGYNSPSVYVSPSYYITAPYTSYTTEQTISTSSYLQKCLFELKFNNYVDEDSKTLNDLCSIKFNTDKKKIYIKYSPILENNIDVTGNMLLEKWSSIELLLHDKIGEVIKKIKFIDVRFNKFIFPEFDYSNTDILEIKAILSFERIEYVNTI